MTPAAASVTASDPGFAPGPGADALAAVLAAPTRDAAGPDQLTLFRRARTVRRALEAWFGEPPDLATRAGRDAASLRLNAAVAEVDRLLNDQLHAVIAHPDFVRLEASWRGLRYLVDQTPEGPQIKVRVLNLSWRDLVRDQERALEFDQSQLFRKVYSDEFGTPGGEPYGLLVGDYAVCHRPLPGHPTDDVAALAGVASVAAAAFAPFVTGIDPRFLGLDTFTDLDPTIDVTRLTAGVDHAAWRRFRGTEDARFVGLALPRVVLRGAHREPPRCGFPFVQPPDGALYGTAAWGFAGVVVRAFAESGWLAAVRGPGGVVPGLTPTGPRPEDAFPATGVVDTPFTDRQDKELSDLGLVPLCHQPGMAGAAFYSAPSCQEPRGYADAVATANARLSAALPYVLCASRVGHYLKVLMRDRVGAFASGADAAEYLRRWVSKYVVSNDSASTEMKAKYPLREARVDIRDVPGRPGQYRCTVHLRPHYQLDALAAGIKLTTDVGPRG